MLEDPDSGVHMSSESSDLLDWDEIFADLSMHPDDDISI